MGVGAAGSGPPRGTPPHPNSVVGACGVRLLVSLSYCSGVGLTGRPPVGAPDRMIAGPGRAGLAREA